MKTVSLETAQSCLAELLAKAADGEEITITLNGQPKARLISMPDVSRPVPRRGSLRGQIRMAADFDAPLEEFKDYTG